MDPRKLIERVRKLERKRSLERLVEALETQPLSLEERSRFLGELCSRIEYGTVTPRAAQILTKAATKGPAAK